MLLKTDIREITSDKLDSLDSEKAKNQEVFGIKKMKFLRNEVRSFFISNGFHPLNVYAGENHSYVELKSNYLALKAIEQLNGSMLNGIPISLTMKRPIPTLIIKAIPKTIDKDSFSEIISEMGVRVKSIKFHAEKHRAFLQFYSQENLVEARGILDDMLFDYKHVVVVEDNKERTIFIKRL